MTCQQLVDDLSGTFAAVNKALMETAGEQAITKTT